LKTKKDLYLRLCQLQTKYPWNGCNKTSKCLAYLHNCVLELLRNFSGMMHLFGVPSYTGRRSQSAIVIPTVDTKCSSALHLSVKSKQTWRHGSMGLSPPGTHFGRNKEQRIKLLYGEHLNSGISLSSKSPLISWKDLSPTLAYFAMCLYPALAHDVTVSFSHVPRAVNKIIKWIDSLISQNCSCLLWIYWVKYISTV